MTRKRQDLATQTEAAIAIGGTLLAILCGFLTGLMIPALLVFIAIYTSWTVLRMHNLKNWLADGSPIDLAPQSNGQIASIIQLVSRSQRSGERRIQKLQGSLERYNDMAAFLPDATIVLDDHLQIRWCNPAAEQLLGLNSQRDQQMRIDNLIRDPSFQAFINQNNPSLELEMDSPVNASIKLILRRVASGSGLSILTGRDITQRVQMREMRKAFVADVSHELRTPLTVIQGYSELLDDDKAMEPALAQALRNISQQAGRMRTIVDDLLLLSRLESTELHQSDCNTIHISSLIGELAGNLASAYKHTHSVTVDGDETLYLNAVQKEVHSACENLLQNALRYTPEGTQVVVTWQRVGNEVHLSVVDDGDGIEPEHLPRLSERFYRVDKGRSREQGGTGLGLAIVKYIMQRHGGRMDILSEPGQGSTFTLVFPEKCWTQRDPVANSA